MKTFKAQLEADAATLKKIHANLVKLATGKQDIKAVRVINKSKPVISSISQLVVQSKAVVKSMSPSMNMYMYMGM